MYGETLIMMSLRTFEEAKAKGTNLPFVVLKMETRLVFKKP
jgi:hypothetical protein